MSGVADKDITYLLIVRIINGVCLVPYALLLIIYLIKIKECNLSKWVNVLLGFSVSLMNISYFIQSESAQSDYPCRAQGSMYVTSLLITVFFCFFISILFFLIAVKPQLIDKYTNCYFGFFIAFCIVNWLAVYSALVIRVQFSINPHLSVCRINQDASQTAYYIFICELIIITLISLVLSCIVLFCGKKIAKTQEAYEKYSKKMSSVNLIQTLCLTLLLFNRFSEAKFKSQLLTQILDNVLCLFWMILVCVNGYNKQTRNNIFKLFGIKVTEDNRDSSNPEAMLLVLRNTFASQASEII